MSLRYIQEVVVASTDVAAAVAFHGEAFGLEPLAGEAAADAADAADGVLLGVPGVSGGRLRIVATEAQAGEAPAVWDLGARLLGIYSRDLERTVNTMGRAGGAPRTPVTYAYGASSLSELVGAGADGVWWTVPLAVAGAHRPSEAYDADAERLHSELHTVVLVVDDHDGARALFEAGGLTTAFDGVMSGPPFDELVGMPAEAGLRLAFLVGPEQGSARLELMSFTGVESTDRSQDPVGIQRLVFVVDDVQQSHAALVGAGAESLAPDLVRGPVGVEIQLVEPQRVP